MSILVGTSGFRYTDWRETFYPGSLKERDFLGFYEQHFPVVEINYTYYAMPGLKTMASLAGRTKPGFKFCIKAHRSMTHDIVQNEVTGYHDETGKIFEAFKGALAPIISEGKLGCVLIQFPWKFKPSQASFDYVLHSKDCLEGLPVVIEFRSNEWVREETFRFLKSEGVGFCCVDEPRLRGLMPPITVVTSSIGYVRFHGRNKAKWYAHETVSDRYDYLYSREELSEWVPKVKSISENAKETYVFFNNCYAGYAPANALMMMEMLKPSPEDPLL
jgi:uncharacterized protein YecE (DUF72 family)